MGHHVAVPHAKVLREALSHFVEQTFPSRYQHYVDPRRRDLPRKFLAYSRRGTRDKCPGAEPFFIECCSHLFAPFCLLRACCVGCVINDSAANKRWASSINFVNAAGLRPQDSALVGLSNFPSFDRNHADEELGKLRFGFFEHRGTHQIDTQSLRKLDCGSPNKTFQCARDGRTRDATEDRFFIKNARNQSE